MNTQWKAFIILLTLAQAVLPVMAICAVSGAYNHAGDFTWRSQWIISHLNLPAFLALLFSIVASILVAAMTGYAKFNGKLWAAGAGVLLIAAIFAVTKIRLLQGSIMSWEPNCPPAEWGAARDALCGSYMAFTALTSLAAALFIWGIFSQGKAEDQAASGI